MQTLPVAPFMCMMPIHPQWIGWFRGWWKRWCITAGICIYLNFSRESSNFVDTDPGCPKDWKFERNCVSAKDGAFDSEVESILPKDLNVTGLSVGPHLVGVRYKDNNNTWGEVLYQTIHVYDANPSGSGSGGSGGGGSGSSGGFASISAAEYFVDTDPGAGSGIAFQAKDGAFDSEVESILPKDLNVTGLSVGPHLVGVRYKDNNNTWGEVLYQTIHVYDANPSGSGSGGSGGGGSGSSGGFASFSRGIFCRYRSGRR